MEEDLKKAEEEKQRRHQEALRAKAEQERLEKERKEKKKQKEKERIARKKLEGTFETKEQKEARQRALLQLQAMGVKIPSRQEAEEAEAADAKRAKPKYGRLRKNQGREDGKGGVEAAEVEVRDVQFTLERKIIFCEYDYSQGCEICFNPYYKIDAHGHHS